MCDSPLLIYGKDRELQRVSCGQCRRCRINRKMMWIGRLRLEAMDHSFAVFRTLTYGVNAPDDVTTAYSDVQEYLKRLRYRVGKFRFYCRGEQGELFQRSHWHLMLFGVPPVLLMQRRSDPDWDHGLVFDGHFNALTAGYVSAYHLEGEGGLMRCSLKPGIGLSRLEKLGAQFFRSFPEVPALPRYYNIGSDRYPLLGTAALAFERGYENAGGFSPGFAPPGASGDPHSWSNGAQRMYQERKGQNGASKTTKL